MEDGATWLDIGVTTTMKIEAVALTAFLLAVFGWLAAGLGGGFGPAGWTVGLVLFATVAGLVITAAIRTFRYRVWLEDGTLAVQQAFRVCRFDLAQADVVLQWAEAQENPSGPQTGVTAMVVRDPGRKRGLRVRLLDSRNRRIPPAQFLALADAIAGRDGPPPLSALGLRDAASAGPSAGA
ncbi:hypothetical protein DZF91_00835 [Actinomadura logoneensis]|uniref:Uncharacterized protein n=1 Tax=Actinomadura logoneensis TaxID=2293572 RepID=A0A372JUR3_9ACTN|nr:hypothetical protein [Actinomadura logoneensis]RFU43484.1 hypothetical protein DZF91_00835 [Actinomadura logoneensis]